MEPKKYNIREILAAGGVILSLVFVGIEVQQNTNAVKATAIMEYYKSAHDIYSMRVDSPEIARVIGIVFDDMNKLTQQEEQIFIGFAMAGLLSTQGAYRLWTMGVLPDEEWESAIQTTCPDENSDEKIRSTMQMIWNGLKSMLLPSFVEAVESACGYNKTN